MTIKWVCYRDWEDYKVVQVSGVETAKQFKADERYRALDCNKVVSKDDPRLQETRDGAIKAMQRKLEAELAELDDQRQEVLGQLDKVIELYHTRLK